MPKRQRTTAISLDSAIARMRSADATEASEALRRSHRRRACWIAPGKDRVFHVHDFLRSLETVRSGGIVVDPEVISSLMQHRQGRLAALTARERARRQPTSPRRRRLPAEAMTPAWEPRPVQKGEDWCP